MAEREKLEAQQIIYEEAESSIVPSPKEAEDREKTVASLAFEKISTYISFFRDYMFDVLSVVST